MNGACNGPFFGPALWGPGEEPKGQISLNIIKFQLQSQFQRFFNQTVCVFSHMKDIKHIRRDFHLAAWVMPQGWDFGYRGGWGASIFFSKFNQIWCVSYLHEWHMHWHHFLGPQHLGPWGGAKRSNIIKSELQKVSNGAKIRNRYNQVPHLTQDTNGKVTNSQKTPQTRAKRSALSQQVTTKHTQTDVHKT